MTPDRPGRAQVVVFGSTGTAGTGAVHACLAEPGVSEVRAVTRRSLGVSHDKLKEVPWSDFAVLGGLAQQLKGVDCCLFCLGTSVRNVSREDQYRKIHVSDALIAGRALLAESPDASFVYLSGAGAKRTSRMMWARVKAEAEDGLAELKLARHANVRPAAILSMQPTGTNRWLLSQPGIRLRSPWAPRSPQRHRLVPGRGGACTSDGDTLFFSRDAVAPSDSPRVTLGHVGP